MAMVTVTATTTFSCRGSIIGGGSGGGDEVYVAAVPLRAKKGPGQLLMSAAYSLNFRDLKHFVVIIKPSATHQALAYDFQPEDPENILVALAAVSGCKVPAVGRWIHLHITMVPDGRDISDPPTRQLSFGLTYHHIFSMEIRSSGSLWGLIH
ncbi:uncharacterized protein LOC142522885 isoform X3 [Primulina tabacum]|uniref:uncharacterized protein LOC142522885 isoform X3 n=1 Tax=Primulina tabacum TaxID=48773 RepID=UPI003F59A702